MLVRVNNCFQIFLVGKSGDTPATLPFRLSSIHSFPGRYIVVSLFVALRSLTRHLLPAAFRVPFPKASAMAMRTFGTIADAQRAIAAAGIPETALEAAGNV